ncbi:MAG: hypothetical protein ACXVRN_07115, partial [Solirubrobacteraceae bacterium]
MPSLPVSLPSAPIALPGLPVALPGLPVASPPPPVALPTPVVQLPPSVSASLADLAALVQSPAPTSPVPPPALGTRAQPGWPLSLAGFPGSGVTPPPPDPLGAGLFTVPGVPVDLPGLLGEASLPAQPVPRPAGAGARRQAGSVAQGRRQPRAAAPAWGLLRDPGHPVAAVVATVVAAPLAHRVPGRQGE